MLTRSNASLSNRIFSSSCQPQYSLRRATVAVRAAAAAAHTVDVAIAGGGPAGLAAAAALHAADAALRVHVFEKSDLRARGAAVMVGANGLMALDAIDSSIVARLMDKAVNLKGADRYNAVTGEFLEHLPTLNEEYDSKYGFHNVLVGWSDITACLRDVLPPGSITSSTSVTGYQQLPDGTLQILGTTQTPGSSSSSSSNSSRASEVLVSCKALIGADGWFSKIRQQLLADEPPVFRDTVVFRARVQRPDWLSSDVTRWWVPEGGPSAAELRCSVMPVAVGDAVWAVHCPLSIMQIKGLDFDPVKGEVNTSLHADNTNTDSGGGCCGCGACSSSSANTKQRCLKVVETLPEQLRQLVAATPGSAISEHGLYQRPPEQIPDERWGCGMVTLVGDAAHTAYVDGTGMALSFEDAAVLGWHVQQLGLTEAALRVFEAQRIPRVKAVFEMTAAQAAAAAAGVPREVLLQQRAELLYGQACFKPLRELVAM